jgi:hypothetical protein
MTARRHQTEYLYLSSRSSLDYYPYNNGSNFMIQLPAIYHGKWTLGIKQIYIRFPATCRVQFAYICCEHITASYAFGGLLPILKCLFVNNKSEIYQEYQNVIFSELTKDSPTTLRLYIMDENRKILSESNVEVICTLQMQSLD